LVGDPPADQFMSTCLLTPAEWAQNEFGFAQLGDQRRNRRLVNIAEHLAVKPGGTLPQAFPEWAELKAAYRFFWTTGRQFRTRFGPACGAHTSRLPPSRGVFDH
jgi:hypothetical protein